jgi:16S rRNA (uracil1498-N3)-methyltransferase
MSPTPDLPPDGSDGPHVFVADIAAPHLDQADDHHLRRALRLRDGDPFTVSDGRGQWRQCRLGAVVEVTGETVEVAKPESTLAVAFALTKGAKPELVVQKLTELGIDRILMFCSRRSIARWDDAKEAKNLVRLGRIAREAGMQSRRVRLPEVAMIGTFSDAAGLDGAVMADSAGGPLTAQTTVLIGPEGGWAPEERAELPTVCLGPHVLRAETAAIATATLLMDRHRC